MKKISLALAVVILSAGASFVGAKVSNYDYTDAKNTKVITNDFFDENNLKVTRFQDDLGNTCYLTLGHAKDLPTNVTSSISCIK